MVVEAGIIGGVVGGREGRDHRGGEVLVVVVAAVAVEILEVDRGVGIGVVRIVGLTNAEVGIGAIVVEVQMQSRS